MAATMPLTQSADLTKSGVFERNHSFDERAGARAPA